MTLLFALLVLQAPAPTVGDTVWLRRSLSAPGSARIEPRRFEPLAGSYDPLGPAEVAAGGGRVTLRWPVAFWAPGRHEVVLPAVLVTSAVGRVDSVAPLTVSVEIASVLPRGAQESTLAPQPPAAVLPIRRRSWWPLLAALLAAAAGAWLLWRWWTARGDGGAEGPGAPASAPPVERWAGAGEVRAVAHSAAARLRGAIAAAYPPAGESLDTERCLRLLADQRPAWPLEEVGGCLRRLDTLRFGPDDGVAEPLALWTEAQALAARLEAAP